MGVWGSPQTVSGCAQGAAGTVAAPVLLVVPLEGSRGGNASLARPDVETVSVSELYIHRVALFSLTKCQKSTPPRFKINRQNPAFLPSQN